MELSCFGRRYEILELASLLGRKAKILFERGAYRDLSEEEEGKILNGDGVEVGEVRYVGYIPENEGYLYVRTSPEYVFPPDVLVEAIRRGERVEVKAEEMEVPLVLISLKKLAEEGKRRVFSLERGKDVLFYLDANKVFKIPSSYYMDGEKKMVDKDEILKWFSRKKSKMSR